MVIIQRGLSLDGEEGNTMSSSPAKPAKKSSFSGKKVKPPAKTPVKERFADSIASTERRRPAMASTEVADWSIQQIEKENGFKLTRYQT